MYQDPDMPDFDSMSQDELIEWLETLAHRQIEESADLPDDFDSAAGEMNPDLAPDFLNDEEWSAWIAGDADLKQDTPPLAAPSIAALQDIDEDDDETPTALPVIEEAGSDDTTDPLTELGDIIATGEPAASVEADAAQEEGEDPLEWLESLANEVSDAAADSEPAIEAVGLLDEPR